MHPVGPTSSGLTATKSPFRGRRPRKADAPNGKICDASGLMLRRASFASVKLRRRMVGGTGFEPVQRFLQACVELAASVSAETADTQLRTQKLGESSSETMSSVEWLREVIEAWPKLSAEL